MKAGLVLVNFNGSEVLRLTLHSLLRAKVKTPFSVCLVENGSQAAQAESAHQFFQSFVKERDSEDSDLFIRSKTNLGFCGGNNAGIRKLMEDGEISRICLLNTDVIVTDGWLDILMESDAEVVGPVTNANGNEQTVWVDYKVTKDLDAFEAVNEFAAFRRNIYAGYEVETECVTGFCSLIKRETIEKVGLLDERFFPGGFDDCDYDRSVVEAGGRIAIRRDCFIHHWGGSSFGKLAERERFGISYANLNRYETKWNTKWKGTQRLLPSSLMQDVLFLRDHHNENERAWALLEKTESAISKILENHERAQIGSIRRKYRQEIRNQLEKNIRPLPYVPDPGVSGVCREIIKAGKTFYYSLRAPGRRKSALGDVLDFIARGRENGKGTVAVLAPYWRPEKLRDGYFLRIIAVDRDVLDGYNKLYFESDPGRVFSVETVDENHMVIHFPIQNPELFPSLKMLLKACGVVYAHSLLRFVHSEIDPEMLQWLTEGNVKLVWDVHGAVPEEAAFDDNWIGAQMYQVLEEVLMRGSAAMICVNHAMKDHLLEKYRYLEKTPKPIVLPILPEMDDRSELLGQKLKNSDYRRPLAVYAGGLQPWQNIDLMQDIMAEAGDRYRYEMVVSNPDQFREALGQRQVPSDTVIHSVAPDQMKEVYEKCHFGFILRDDVAVNHVACPTKLIEYICYGIVPVMKTEKIGDFVRYGMKYIAFEDFAKGRIPTETEFVEMTSRNREVLSRIKEEYTKGKSVLQAFMEGGDRA